MGCECVVALEVDSEVDTDADERRTKGEREPMEPAENGIGAVVKKD